MKKGKLILAALLSAAVLLTGCSGKDHGLRPDNPVSITVWHYYNGAQAVAFDEMVDTFNQTVGKEKGISVNVKEQGSIAQLEESMRNSAAKKVGADELPDIFTGYADLVLELDKDGVIAALDGYFTEEELSGYVEAFVEEGRIGTDGKLKVLPTAKSTEVMMINRTDWDFFADATGADTADLATCEGVVRTAEKYYEWTDSLTDAPDDGKAFFGRDAYANYLLVGSKQLGAEIFEVNKNQVVMNLDREIMKRLWDNFYVPYVKGYFTAIGRFRSDDAKTGDVIAFVGSSSSSTYFPDVVNVDDTTSYPIECEVFPVPGFEGTENYAVQQGAGMAVTKSSETREYASAVFLKWFTEKEQNVKFAANSAYMPVKLESLDLETMKNAIHTEGKDLVPKVGETMAVAIRQMKEYHLYTPKAFDNGNAARNVLESSMIDAAKEDREQILNSMAQGMTREDALKPYLTEERFDTWFGELYAELEALLSNGK